MAVLFYPQEDELQSASLEQKLEILLEASERYKAVVLEMTRTSEPVGETKKRMTPRDLKHAFNWEELAKLMREIRELPEGNAAAKLEKSNKLTKLAEVYEVLRGAKMAKLEAVRIALMNEANQLRAGSSQVA